MSLYDYFMFGMGMSLGADLAKIGITKAEHMYREKYFFDIVRRDLKALEEKGILENKAYPFPTTVKNKKPPFFMRHKVLCTSWIIAFVLSWLIYEFLGRTDAKLAAKIIIVILTVSFLFSIGCYIVIFVKKIARGGKKVADFAFQKKYIDSGRGYWEVREKVREAMQSGNLDVANASYHLKNTELGRMLFYNIG